MDSEPRFDIFSGAADKNAGQAECVCGLSNARERMEQIAAKKLVNTSFFSPKPFNTSQNRNLL